MKPLKPAILKTAIAIAIALTSLSTGAQQIPQDQQTVGGGLYVTVTQNEIYIIKDGKTIDVKTGETAWVGENSVEILEASAKFLNWPCGESGTQNQLLLPSYTIDSLEPENRIEQILKKFMEAREIPDPAPNWLIRESHASFSAEEISKYLTSAYWYETGMTTEKMGALRPKVLLISAYPATRQVVVDQNHFQELQDFYGSDKIPVTFVFNAKNVVPISYLGNKVNVYKVADLFFKRGVSVAEVPMWYAGDRHLEASVTELEELFEIPETDEINPDRMKALIADMQSNGFSKKPINIAIIAQNNSMVIDEADKVRAAQSIGIDLIPTVFFYYDEDSVKKRCGLIEAGGSSLGSSEGGSTDIRGFAAPPEQVPSEN